MKRVISIILVVAMLCSMCVTTAFAAEKVTLKIETATTSVSAGDSVTFTVSLEGNTTKKVAAVGFNIDIPSDFEYVSHSLADGLPTNATYTSRTGTFGFYDGQTAAPLKLLEVTFKVKDTTTYGKKTVSFKNDDDLAISDNDDESFDITLGQQEVAILKAPLAAVSATVTAPVKGAALDTTGTVAAGEPYTISKVEWFEGENAGGTTVTGNAKANQVYTAQLAVKANDGESFAASLDGKTTADGYAVVRANGAAVTLTKTFAATADKDAPVCTAPTGVTATYGDKLGSVSLANPAGNTDGKWYWMDDTQEVGNVKDNPHTYKAKFIPSDKENYTTVENIDVSVTVNKKQLGAGCPVMIPFEMQYTGSALEPAPQIKTDTYGDELVLNQDYKITKYENNISVGDGRIYIESLPDGNYSFSSSSYAFKILPAYGEITIAASGTIIYDGSAVEAGASGKDLNYTYGGDGVVTVKWYADNNGVRGNELPEGAPKNAGTYWIGVSAAAGSNYTPVAEVTQKFTITPKSLTADMITLGEQATYDGSVKNVVITSIRDGETALTQGADYTVSSGDKAADVQDTALIITGKGNYKGTASAKWSLRKAAPEARDFSIPALSAQTYDGKTKPVVITAKTGINGMGSITVKYNGSATVPVNAGDYTVTFDVAEGQNYKAASGLSAGTFKINQAALTGTDKVISIRYTDAAVKTFAPSDFGFTRPGALTVKTTGGSSVLAEGYPKASNGSIQVKLADGLTADKVDSTAVVELTFTPTDTNYKAAAVKLTINVTDKTAQAPLALTGDMTVVYGRSLTLGTTGGSGNGAVTYIVTEGTGKATISGNVLKATQAGTVTVKAIKAATDEYSAVESRPVTITITKAKPSGTPSYTAITADGKTLSDAALGVGTITPAGTIKWVDENGTELAATTPVEAGKSYTWRFVPEDTTNYEELTGSVQLWHKSTNGKHHRPSSGSSGKITISAVLTAEDAGSATDYTSGIYGLTFRSSADFSGFQGIKVDGKTVDKENYIAENNGGIEIYLKAAYLKTLADGNHTLTIMTADGDASIDFTIGGVTTSPKTFDAGIAMYAAMAAASLTGMAWLSKKKEN